IHLMTNERRECTAFFRQALELAPDHFEARLYLTAALIDFDAREAVEHLEILRRRDPQNSQVCLLLATLRHAFGQFQEAQQILDEILTRDPDHETALLERGKVALDAGRPADAEPFLQRALARTPDGLSIHRAMARCLQLA